VALVAPTVAEAVPVALPVVKAAAAEEEEVVVVVVAAAAAAVVLLVAPVPVLVAQVARAVQGSPTEVPVVGQQEATPVVQARARVQVQVQVQARAQVRVVALARVPVQVRALAVVVVVPCTVMLRALAVSHTA